MAISPPPPPLLQLFKGKKRLDNMKKTSLLWQKGGWDGYISTLRKRRRRPHPHQDVRNFFQPSQQPATHQNKLQKVLRHNDFRRVVSPEATLHIHSITWSQSETIIKIHYGPLFRNSSLASRNAESVGPRGQICFLTPRHLFLERC